MTTSRTMRDIMTLLKLCGVTPEGGFVILTLVENAGAEREMWDWMTTQTVAPTENMILFKAMELDGQFLSEEL